MSNLRDDKKRPLFQEAIVTKLEVTQSASRYQMKATDIIFPMIPHESLWVKWFPKFSVKESRDNSSQSILKSFKLEDWTQTCQKKLTLFKRSQSRVMKLSLI